MQPIRFIKFLRQLVVLVQRNLQLIWNDKLLLASLALQSPFMVLVVKLTADPNCFTSNLVNIGSRTALFILAAMATFMGTLNSYREICKEREIILRDASVGVSLQAVVLSKAAVLLLVEIAQAAILALGFVSIVHVPQNHLLLETDMEIFVTLLLTMFSSSCVGLLISALFTNGESAILAVLVLGIPFSHHLASYLGWTALVTMSVLVHEAGHVIALRRFGFAPTVELGLFGGLTAVEGNGTLDRVRSIAVSLAGPVTGLAFGMVIHAGTVVAGADPTSWFQQANWFVNIWWSLLNLLPVMPLDGGHIAREVFEAAGETRTGT